MNSAALVAQEAERLGGAAGTSPPGPARRRWGRRSARRRPRRVRRGRRGRCGWWTAAGRVSHQWSSWPPRCGVHRREGQAWTLPPGEGAHCERMLAIGEFSRLTHLSVRTLRRYHDADLLEPGHGRPRHRLPLLHRRPDPDRPGHPPAPRARRPAPRRPADRCAPPTPTPARRLVAEHLAPARVAELDRTTRRRRVAAPAARARPRAPCTSSYRRGPRRPVAAVEDDVSTGRRPGLVRRGHGRAGRGSAAAGARPVAPGGLYDNALFDRRLAATSWSTCPTRSRRGPARVSPRHAAGRSSSPSPPTAASTTTSTSPTASWAPGSPNNALAVAGPVRETYLVGPRDTADPPAWRTEIGWPVFRVAGGRDGCASTPPRSASPR